MVLARRLTRVVNLGVLPVETVSLALVVTARRSSQRVVNLAPQLWTLSVLYWSNSIVVDQLKKGSQQMN